MIGIIAAMDEEVQAIAQTLSKKEELEISGIQMIQGELENKKVVVIKSGVGKAYAAMSTAILLEHFTLEFIMNIGTAGGICDDQNILDAVVSTQVVQHDYDTSSIDGEEGRGLYFHADASLVKRCVSVLQQMDICVHAGCIASGDQFIAREEDLMRLKNYFPKAICAEMEAGAIAQVCHHYKVPFVVLRSLSDIANKVDSHLDFQTYVTHASARSAAFTRAFMQYAE